MRVEHEAKKDKVYTGSMGRPSSYTEEIVDEICERLANGESLKGISQDSHIPHMSTVFRWLDTDTSGFRDKYARARESQIEAMAAEIIHIADTCREGVKTKETEDGIETVTGDMIERSRLQVDARKWLLSKLAPKKYGDAQTLTIEAGVSLADVLSQRAAKVIETKALQPGDPSTEQ